MSKGPKTVTQNTYGSPAPFSSPATEKLQSMAVQGSDPSIPYHYAQKREDDANSWRNPLGAWTSAAVRDAAGRVTSQRDSMDEANAIQRSKFATDQANFARQLGVVGATQPFQTGGTQTQNPGWGAAVGKGLNAATQVATAAI